MDILDLGSERLTWGRLWRLINELPETSRTAIALHGEQNRWGATEHLLASVYDAVMALDHTLRTVNTRKGRKAERPEPMWRPGQPPKRARTTLPGREIARRLVAMSEAARGR